MVHYLGRRGLQDMGRDEQNKLLFWYLNCALWGRYSGSTESIIDKDLKILENGNLATGLDDLITELHLWHGDLTILPDHFSGWSLGARFYPLLYLLTRTQDARDWGTGMPLKADLLGRMSRLEVHHIFPKAQLYKKGYQRAEVNALSNFCFLTKTTNLRISDELPQSYFPAVEAAHPGTLHSQWIPRDETRWDIDNYPDFLKERRKLLADAANAFITTLLPSPAFSACSSPCIEAPIPSAAPQAPGGIVSQEEEAALVELNAWMIEHGFPAGTFNHEVIDQNSGQPVVILDLAWPDGIQQGFSQPVAVLLDEENATLKLANEYGFRYVTGVGEFKRYVGETME